MRNQSNQAQHQLTFLRQYLVHWGFEGRAQDDHVQRSAGREDAAPHVKTYIRYSDDEAKEIEWAMLTSANLSTQAWGTKPKNGQVRISSYEVGVVVWPFMLQEDEGAKIIPTFQHDRPDASRLLKPECKSLIGLRIPYSLPLKSYGRNDEPWIATAAYDHPDIHGIVQRPWRQP